MQCYNCIRKSLGCLDCLYSWNIEFPAKYCQLPRKGFAVKKFSAILTSVLLSGILPSSSSNDSLLSFREKQMIRATHAVGEGPAAFYSNCTKCVRRKISQIFSAVSKMLGSAVLPVCLGAAARTSLARRTTKRRRHT